MGKLPLRVSVLLSKNIQFKGVLYSKFTLCAACVYLIWGFFHMSTPSGLSTLQSKLWFSSFAVLLCAYFILPQYSLHQMMIETKKEKLGMFSSRLKDKAEEAIRNPTKENASILKNMLDIQCQLDEMCKWPFGYYEILHIVLIVIIPLIVVALEIFISLFLRTNQDSRDLMTLASLIIPADILSSSEFEKLSRMVFMPPPFA